MFDWPNSQRIDENTNINKIHENWKTTYNLFLRKLRKAARRIIGVAIVRTED